MKRVYNLIFGMTALGLLSTGCSTSVLGEKRMELGTWSNQHRLGAWGDLAIVITPKANALHKVTAYSAHDGVRWEREVDCVNSDVLAEGLLCVGKNRLLALSGRDGGNLWKWESPVEIRNVQYEGARVTVAGSDRGRHTVDTANGHEVAAGPVETALFTSGGSLSVTAEGGVLRAHRTRNGETQWTALPALWPTHRILLHHLLFRGVEPDGRHFLGLVDSETRLLLNRAINPAGERLLAVNSTPEGVLVVQESGITALRAGNSQQMLRGGRAQAWALGHKSIVSVESVESGYELVWNFSGRVNPSAEPESAANEALLSRPGVTFHGAWLDTRKQLTHVEVRVKRWSPDLLYAWRTSGPWTARRISPVAAGDRGLNPAFDGDQDFSPMPLWFSPTTVAKLKQTGGARVGKLVLTKVGWSYHQVVLQEGKGAAGKPVALPVMVVARADNNDRYWISPNGANPVLVRAERRGGIFYLAGMTVPEDLER